MILGFESVAFQAAEITACMSWYISGEQNQVACLTAAQVLDSVRVPLGFQQSQAEAGPLWILPVA